MQMPPSVGARSVVPVGLAADGGALQRQAAEGGRGVDSARGGETPGRGAVLPAGLGARVERERGGGRPLGLAERAFFEPRFGFDLGDVRLHTGAAAADLARAAHARAFAVGRDLFFGDGQYEPGTDRGRWLLAHEVTHVLQQRGQPDGTLRRAPLGACPAAREPEPDYEALAEEVHEGVDYLWGTDEERVYRALRRLDRDAGRVCRLKETYLRRYGAALLEDIEGDFSGEELAYALELLGIHREASFEQRVQAGPITRSGFVADARRLYEAGPGRTGTDEEAIFAVLTPLAGTSAMANLEAVYRREYGHTIEAMIDDEMSDSERDYALELLHLHRGESAEDGRSDEEGASDGLEPAGPQIARWVREAYDRLSSEGLGLHVWWERRADGSARWDDRYWVFPDEEAYERRELDPADLRLVLKPGVPPHVAVDALFDEPGRWEMDCGQFVQVARLYVRRKLLPPPEKNDAFDEQERGLELRTHAPESARYALFERVTDEGRPLDLWRTDPLGRIDPMSEERMLDMAPVGSRVRWTSAWTKEIALKGQGLGGSRVLDSSWFLFQNENAIKLGPDSYGAHGIGRVSGSEVVEGMVDATRDALKVAAYWKRGGERIVDVPTNPSDEEIREHVYVDNVEYYRW